MVVELLVLWELRAERKIDFMLRADHKIDFVKSGALNELHDDNYD